MPRTWRRILSASSSVTFGDAGPSGRRLELHLCCLLPRADGVTSASSRGPTLYCSVGENTARYALAKPTEASPVRKLRTSFFSDGGISALSVVGAGKVLVVGVVRKDRNKLNTKRSRPNVDIYANDEASAMLQAQAKIDRLKKEIASMKTGEAIRSSRDQKKHAKKTDVVNTKVAMKPRKRLFDASQNSIDGHSDLKRSACGMDFGFAKPQSFKEMSLEAHAGESQVLPSGLSLQVISPGKRQGQVACVGDVVQVKYEGRLARSGKQFDKGIINFRVGKGKVIRGWDEGIKGMVIREKRKLFVPAALGYGSRGAPPDIPCNADLDFDVQLLSILP